MRYKTLFRVLLKVLGVYLVVTGSGSFFYLITGIVSEMFGSGGIPSSMWPYGFPGLFSLAIGLYLFFGGKWIADLAIPSNRPYCAECGYDIGHSLGDTCPECGTLILNEKPAVHIEHS